MAETKHHQDNLDARIKHIVEEIRICKADAKQIENCINDLKGELRQLLEEHSLNWGNDTRYARLVIGKRTNIL